MITVESATPSPEPPSHKPSLADLSRNASVISSSSSSSSTTSLLLPARPRPIRTFSSPRSRSPGGPPTPKASRPPAYITRELGIAEQPPDSPVGRSRANSKSKSRSSSANARLSAEDFEFGDILGEGSYSTVMHGTHRDTRQEYAIKVLDKGHLKRNNKLQTALAEKNTLVRLGSGHPGIVRLHWAFQDDWSLCESLTFPGSRARVGQIVPVLGWTRAAEAVALRGRAPLRSRHAHASSRLFVPLSHRARAGPAHGMLSDHGGPRVEKFFALIARVVAYAAFGRASRDFVLDLARNGELQSRISRMGSLSTACARYYTAQLIDALDYMHSRGVIHRDLKPENLLLDDDFRIRVTDFGTGKLIDVPAERATKTFVGTAQYVSPELLEANETSKSSDLWALGCVLYQMIAGRFAFQGLSEYLTWQKIKQLDYTFPDGFDADAADLVRRLLVRDPLERLGAGPPGSAHSMDALRAHPFLASVRWATLWDDPAPPLEVGLVRREIAPPGDAEWDDVGAAWDELVGEPPGDDGIEWAHDAAVPSPASVAFASPPAVPPEDIGPHGEMPDYAREALPDEDADGVGDAPVVNGNGDVEDARSERTVGAALPGIDTVADAIAAPAPLHTPPAMINGKDKSPARASAKSTSTDGADGAEEAETAGVLPLRVPRGVRDSYATSSSDGSPVEKLGAALEAMGIHRGRLRTRSPTPAAPAPAAPAPDTPDWTSVLAAGERMLHHARVEETALKRRTSRLLLPLPVSQRKPKVRELALTSARLVCLKPLKGARAPGVGVKATFVLPGAPGAPGKRAGEVVTGVERRGAREFVVLTTGKSGFFVAEDGAGADAWVRRIAEALQPHAHGAPDTSAAGRERKESAGGRT
ncbi:kinase-like domain-containing protein [Gloeopeniophorella convolvens]|nr:kinase-like domain-containing protein [Gloeopeniophorella convolvens]